MTTHLTITVFSRKQGANIDLNMCVRRSAEEVFRREIAAILSPAGDIRVNLNLNRARICLVTDRQMQLCAPTTVLCVSHFHVNTVLVICITFIYTS